MEGFGEGKSLHINMLISWAERGRGGGSIIHIHTIIGIYIRKKRGWKEEEEEGGVTSEEVGENNLISQGVHLVLGKPIWYIGTYRC